MSRLEELASGVDEQPTNLATLAAPEVEPQLPEEPLEEEVESIMFSPPADEFMDFLPFKTTENAKNKFYYGLGFGVDFPEGYTPEFPFDAANATTKERGFFNNVMESARRGNQQVLLDIAAYESLYEGKGEMARVIAQKDALERQEALDPIEGNFISEMVYGAANILPGMAQGYASAADEAAISMLAGAGLGAAAGAPVGVIGAAPGAATGAVTGLTLGLATGSSQFWYKQGAGSMATEMISKGFDTEVSKRVAAVAAVPYAAIEFLQTSQVTPGLRAGVQKGSQKAMLGVVEAAIKKYGKTWSAEVVEEVIQEVIQVTAIDTAEVLSEGGITIDADFLAERAGRIANTAFEAGKSMALLPLPGAAIDVTTGITSVIGEKQRLKINTDLNRKMTEEFTAEEKAGIERAADVQIAELNKKEILTDREQETLAFLNSNKDNADALILGNGMERPPTTQTNLTGDFLVDTANGDVKKLLDDVANTEPDQDGRRKLTFETAEDVNNASETLASVAEAEKSDIQIDVSGKTLLVKELTAEEVSALTLPSIADQRRNEVERRLRAGEPISERLRTEFADLVKEVEAEIAPEAKDVVEAVPAKADIPEAKVEAAVEPTKAIAAKATTEKDVTRTLMDERAKIKEIPPKERTPQEIARIEEVEDELVLENADEFPEIDISDKTRKAEAKKVKQQILEHELYKSALEGVEDVPQLDGTFAVDSTEMPDIKQKFEGRPDILRKFVQRETGGNRWDQAAKDVGIERFDDFLDAVELFVESGKTVGGINQAAIDLAREGAELDPSIEIFAAKQAMIDEGFNAAEINKELQNIADELNIPPEFVESELMPLEELTDVEKKQRILKELDRTFKKVEKKKIATAEEEAIAKAQRRAGKEQVPLFITEKDGKFRTTINQPSSGDFILVTPPPKGKIEGKVERVTEGKEGLTKVEIKASGPQAAAELIKAQARGEDIGFKAGERVSREKAKVEVQKIKAAQKLTEARKKKARELVKAFVEKERQGDFIKRAAEAKTPRDIEKITEAIEKGIAKAEKREAITNLNRAVKAIKPKRMLPEFAEPAQRIIDSLKLGKLKDDTIVNNAELKDMAQQVLDQSKEDSVAAFQAAAVLEELRGKTAKTFAINQLSLEAIEQITDTLTALRFQNETDTIAGQAENSKEAKRRRTLIKGQILEPPVNPERFGGKGVRKFKLAHDNLESLTDTVAGARPGTYDLWKKSKRAMTEFVYDVLDRGVDNQATHNKQAGNIFRGVLKDNGVSTNQVLSWMARKTSLLNKLTGKNIKPDLKSFTLQDTRGKSKEFEFTANERMSIFMHTRNSHNLAVILNDGFDQFVKGKKTKIRGFTVEIIDDITESLTTQQRTVANQVGSKLMDGFNRDALNETSKKLEFFEVAKVENYWPARRSILPTFRGEILKGSMSLVEGMGILKERVGVGNPMRLTGFMETVHASNRNVSTYVGLAEPLREVKSVLTEDVREEMEDSGRTDEADRIKLLIERVESKLIPTLETEIEVIVQKMLGGFAKSKLFLNLKIAPRQQVSELLISAYVNPKYMAEFRGKSTKALISEITELSPQMGARIEGFQFDRDIGDAFEQNELIHYLTGDISLIDKTGLGMRFFDTNAIVDIYRATKAEVIDNNKGVDINSDEGKALLKDRFEWVVRHTQPVWHVKDRSALGSSRNPLVRLFTMFMSQREQLVRMVNNGVTEFAYSEKNAQDQARLGRTLGTVGFNLFMFSLYNFAWAALVQRKKRDVSDFFRDFFKDILALPFFGKFFAEAFGSSFNVIAEKPTFKQGFAEDPVEGIIASLLLDGLVGFTRAGKHFVDGEKYKSGPNKGKEKWKVELFVAMDSVIDAIASLKGLPYYGAKDIITSVKSQIVPEKKETKRESFRGR